MQIPESFHVAFKKAFTIHRPNISPHKVNIFGMFGQFVWPPGLSSWENIQFVHGESNPTSQVLHFLT